MKKQKGITKTESGHEDENGHLCTRNGETVFDERCSFCKAGFCSEKQKKDPLNPNAHNGIECTCHQVGFNSGCRSSHHNSRPDRYEEFVDKNGTQIKTGDILKYENPNFPDKKQPLHKAKWDEQKKKMMFFVEKVTGEIPYLIRPARGHGRFASERWTIISRGKLVSQPMSKHWQRCSSSWKNWKDC